MRSLSCLKYILCYATLVVMLVLVCSCADENEFAINEGEVPSAVLRLTTRSTVSRSDAHYDDDSYAEANGSLQEEKINRVNLFFFESAETTDAAFYTCELQANATTIADVTVKIPIDKINKFKDGKAYVYALVNIPSDIKLGDILPDEKAATMENLTQLWVESGAFVKKGIPDDFVMRGGGVVTLDNSGEETKVTGWISLERLASKIRLFAGIEQTIYLDDKGKTINRKEGETIEDWQRRAETEAAEIWDSEPYHKNSDGTMESDVNLYIYNAATRGRIDGFLPDKKDSGKREMLGLGNVDRKDESKDAARIVDTGISLGDYRKKQDSEEYADISRDVYPYTHGAAYYSYPNDWDTSNLYEENQTYVILSLPWRRTDKKDGSGEIYQMCYYQIPINKLVGKENGKQKDRLDPNTYYRIKIHLGMLGSKDLGEPLEVEASYEAVEWSNADVDVNIKGRRYLVVNQKEWVMNNTSTLQIPFSSSHKTKIVSCYVTYFRYNDVWGTAPNTNGVHNAEEFQTWVNAANGIEEGWIETDYPLQSETRTETKTKTDRIPWGGLWYERWFYDVETTNDVTNYIKYVNHSEEGLYYKKRYFYDDVKNSYLYYVGHEHPKTYQEDYVKYTDEKLKELNLTADEQKAWEMYKSKYDMDAIYSCTIDDEKSVINFSHPLIQWKEVRSEPQLIEDNKKVFTDQIIETSRELIPLTLLYRTITTTTNIVTYESKYSDKLLYYAPLLNPHSNNSTLWDEFSRCEIVIKIRHEDWEEDDLFEETIHITQYPAMYIEVSHNYGNVYPARDNVTNQAERGNEYVLVNGNKTENKSENHYGTATEWFETSGYVPYYGAVNNNPNMYLIHTSQLSEENDVLYDLGDPRTLYYNNDLTDESFTDPTTNVLKGNIESKNNEWKSKRLDVSNYRVQPAEYTINIASATRLFPESGSNRLKYYYPADESTGVGSKENFIAPSFRIASSFGKVTLISNYYDPVNFPGNDGYKELLGYSRTEARRRCAAYQEGGRPAGRWRVPTLAEIKYLVQLSTDGKIPHLFGLVDTNQYSKYWSANGLVAVNLYTKDIQVIDEDNTKNGHLYGYDTPAVRCVYDEWYWTQVDGKELPTPNGNLETTFYWGDRRKDNTQTQSLIKRMIYQK